MADGDLLGFSSALFGGDLPSAPSPTFEGFSTSLADPTIDFPMTAPTAAPPPDSGLSDFASNLGSGLVKEVTTDPLAAFAKTLGIGATGLGIANQFNVANQNAQATRNVTQAQKAAQAAAAPAVAFGTDTLRSAQQGQLPPPMEAAVQQWVQQAKADIRAKYAQMGLGNSTDLASEDKKIELMAESMRANLLQGQEQTALAGLSTGVSAATGGAQIAEQQQQLLTNLIATANQQLGQLGARSA